MPIQQCSRALHSISAAGLWTAGDKIVGHRLVPTPAWLAQTWQELLDVAGLKRQPQLVTVLSAHGSVAMFLPGLFQANLVAIGLTDVRDLILKARAAGRLQDIPDWVAPFSEERVYSDVELSRAFARAILAHEIGHGILHARRAAKGGVAEEGDADRLAGQLEELLGVESEIGKLVFELVGCAEQFCSHPAPHVRVAAYHEGRQIEIRARRSREAQDAQARWRAVFAS